MTLRPNIFRLACAALTLGAAGPAKGAEIPEMGSVGALEPFSLPHWAGDGAFDSSEHEPGILILDFFAFWCAPCLPASRDLEHGVNRYFESRAGNIHGVPVEVVSINVEAEHPQKTEAFIRESGARFVLNDPEGALFARLGGDVLPYIVMLRGVETSAGTRWEVMYRNSGYPGGVAIRAMADSFGPLEPEVGLPMDVSEPVPVELAGASPAAVQGSPSDRIDPAGEETTLNTREAAAVYVPDAPSDSRAVELPPVDIDEGGDVQNIAFSDDTISPLNTVARATFTADVEVLSSSDIFLFNSGFERRGFAGVGDWDGGLSYGRIHIDYEPVPEADVIGKATHREESNASARFLARLRRSPFVEYQISGGGYYGFTDHRSVWLDEYYRQQFSGLEGYVEAEPWGYNLSAGASWDTRSGAGVLGTTIVFQQDDVAPGYDRPLFQPLVRGRERLYTGALLVEQEGVLSRTVRMRNQIQFTKTTDREMRFRYGGNLNVAPAENWVIRFEGAATYEAIEAEGETDFLSYSGGFTLERDWDQKWFLGLTARGYKDNGQIETSILISSGPPALETRHLGLTLRHRAETTSWKISLAAYSTRFEKVASTIRPFGNLYQDRNWVMAAASFDHVF